VNTVDSVVGHALVELERKELKRVQLELLKCGQCGFIWPITATNRS